MAHHFKRFYRTQVGPNLIVVRDAHGGVFGGFVTEPWRPHHGSYGSLGESFLFSLRKQSSRKSTFEKKGTFQSEDSGSPPSPPLRSFRSLELYYPILGGDDTQAHVVQWSNPDMFGLGKGIVLGDGFLRGSSNKDETFGTTRTLSPAGDDFVVRDFECWHIGGHGRPRPKNEIGCFSCVTGCFGNDPNPSFGRQRGKRVTRPAVVE